MGWKIFFWVYVLFALLSIMDAPTSPKLIDMPGLPMVVLELLALYSYAYKRQILSAKYWTGLLWLYVLFFILFALGAFGLVPALQSVQFETL